MVALISSKYSGNQDPKLKHIQYILKNLTGKTYDLRQLYQAELEILKILDNKLFLHTIVDDLTLCTEIEQQILRQVLSLYV